MFKRDKILSDSELIARELREARQEKKINLKEVAKKLNINYKYLKVLEKGEFNKLPAGIYGKNFLREYAISLGLDQQALIGLYDKIVLSDLDSPRGKKGKRRKRELFSKQVVKARNLLIFPKIIKSLIIITVVIICFVYLGVGVKKIVSQPELYIIEPPNSLVTANNYVIVSGVTEAEAQVKINNEPISLKQDGDRISFAEKVNLKSGINTVVITAKKKYSQEIVIKKQILVNENTQIYE